MQKISPCLWFHNEAEEAANFYVSVFEDGKILNITHYSESSAEASGQPQGSVMTVVFEIDGQQFMALNGGPIFKFSEAVSLMIHCDTQDKVDYYWEKLSAGGEEGQCGWLKDKYGLSWQVVPTALGELLSRGDAEKSESVVKALLPMKKIDIAALQKAYEAS